MSSNEVHLDENDLSRVLSRIRHNGKRVQMKSVKHLIEMTKKEVREEGTMTEKDESGVLREING